MDRVAKLEELNRLKAAVRQLESELGSNEPPSQWPPREYYVAYHVLAGSFLGMIGAGVSLGFNIIGSLLIGQHPLQLIRVYLTFPLGAEALSTQSGLALSIGTCLYLATGMLLGIPFQLVLTWWFPTATFVVRFLVVSALALVLWIINFYGVLAWLQPLLYGGRWIVDGIPWWVAALTHLVFGWTLILVQPLGTFVPYQQRLGAR